MEHILGFVAHKVHQTFKLNPSLLDKPDTLQLIKNILTNIIKNPFEEKFRNIKMTNPKFSEKVVNVPGAFELLIHCGFRTDGESTHLPMEVKFEVIDFVITIIEAYEQGKFVVQKSDTAASLESTLKLTELIQASENLKSDNNPETRLTYAKAVEDCKQEELYESSISMLKETIEECLQKPKDATTTKLLYRLFYRMSSLQFSKGNLEDSLETAKMCKELMNDPSQTELFTETDFGELFHLCGCIFANNKEVKEAVEQFDNALKYNYEKRYNTIRQKCNTLSTHYLTLFMNDNTKLDECVKGLLSLLENDCPGHEHALLVLGIIHQRSDDFDGALKYFRELMNRPDRAEDGVMQAKDYGLQLATQMCRDRGQEFTF